MFHHRRPLIHTPSPTPRLRHHSLPPPRCPLVTIPSRPYSIPSVPAITADILPTSTFCFRARASPPISTRNSTRLAFSPSMTRNFGKSSPSSPIPLRPSSSLPSRYFVCIQKLIPTADIRSPTSKLSLPSCPMSRRYRAPDSTNFIAGSTSSHRSYTLTVAFLHTSRVVHSFAPFLRIFLCSHTADFGLNSPMYIRSIRTR
ncbi:hypothetical protein C8R43DRAFT_994190, partial [Mycena crocata]